MDQESQSTQEQKTRLILICEGGAHTVQYFHNNRVFPEAVVLTATKFREMMPYLTDKDDILVVIHGLTDFSLAEIYALLGDLRESSSKLNKVTVMSDIDLGRVDMPYYIYVGDLFYGQVFEVINGKMTAVLTDKEKRLLDNRKKKPRSDVVYSELNKNQVNNSIINAVISRYKKYSSLDKDKRFLIYGSQQRDQVQNYELDSLTDKLINVDLFSNDR